MSGGVTSEELTEADKALLRRMPTSYYIPKNGRTPAATAADLKRMQALWRRRLVRGEIGGDGTNLAFSLTNKGRAALGLPPIDAPAPEAQPCA